jgi:FkbM family methyltransferase
MYIFRKLVKFLLPYFLVRIYQKYIKKGVMPAYKSELEKVIKNLKTRNVGINTIIDVGASDGRWSEEIMPIFPEAYYFLIEANTIHKKGLDNFKERHNKAEYVLAAAGDEDGVIYFDNADPFGGLAMDEKTGENLIKVPVVTINHCAREHKLEGPFLLKLDTHGFEAPIFEGASEILEKTNIIVVEAYNFKIAKDSLLFHEMCEYMIHKGFRCAGIIDVSYRPKDGFLWQMDLIFVKNTREEFKDNAYR